MNNDKVIRDAVENMDVPIPKGEDVMNNETEGLKGIMEEFRNGLQINMADIKETKVFNKIFKWLPEAYRKHSRADIVDVLERIFIRQRAGEGYENLIHEYKNSHKPKPQKWEGEAEIKYCAIGANNYPMIIADIGNNYKQGQLVKVTIEPIDDKKE